MINSDQNENRHRVVREREREREREGNEYQYFYSPGGALSPVLHTNNALIETTAPSKFNAIQFVERIERKPDSGSRISDDGLQIARCTSNNHKVHGNNKK